MLDELGVFGIVGGLLVLAGVGVTAYANPLVGAGLALIVAGAGLLVKEGIDTVKGLFGL